MLYAANTCLYVLCCVAVLQSKQGMYVPPLLHDCPLLSAHDLQLMQSSPPTVPGTCQPLTLQQLQSPEWWQYLPGELRDSWRRSAAVPGFPAAEHQQHHQSAGLQQQQHMAATAAAAAAAGEQPAGLQPTCSSVSGGVLFTPHARQLEQEGPVGLLARLVFWARWRLGEPIIVQGVKVGRLRKKKDIKGCASEYVATEPSVE